MQNTANTKPLGIWNFNATDLVYNFVKFWRDALRTYKMSKN